MSNSVHLPEVNLPERFAPYAVFDQHLDCIRVLTADVSVCEVRVDEAITVYRSNFPAETGQSYVGFTLKGVNHLFHELGLELDRAFKVSEILDTIVRERPATVMAVVLDLIRDPLQDAAECEVRVLEDLAA